MDNSQPSGEAPERITAGPCGKCGAMVVGLNACPHCGCDWIGTRVPYVRGPSPDSMAEKAQRAAKAVKKFYDPWVVNLDSVEDQLANIIAAELQK